MLHRFSAASHPIWVAMIFKTVFAKMGFDKSCEVLDLGLDPSPRIQKFDGKFNQSKKLLGT